MSFLTALIFIITLSSFALPGEASSDVVVNDMIALKGEEVMLEAETRGRFFRKGGEIVEFGVDGKSLGRTLSGGDGRAFRKFVPAKLGIHVITARSSDATGKGLLLSLRKGSAIVFIDVEGSLIEGPFSRRPKQGSKEALKDIGKRYPVVFLSTGLLGAGDIKGWLGQQGFIEMPVLPWRGGAVFSDVAGRGLRIKAVIGGPEVIESAKEYGPESFSFVDMENAETVKDWEEIRKKLK